MWDVCQALGIPPGPGQTWLEQDPLLLALVSTAVSARNVYSKTLKEEDADDRDFKRWVEGDD